MIFQVSNGSFPAAISNNHIHSIAHPDTPPEMGAWEKIEDFFCEMNKPEALECIRRIYHPPGRTIWEDVVSRFERLRALAYAGCRENIQFGRHGEGHFSILDSASQEVLSVTTDNAGKYTVNCQGHNETHNLNLRTELRAEDYEAVWSAWENIAPPEESYHRAVVVQKMRDCLNNGNPELDLSNFDITSLPDRLPPNMVRLILDNVPLTSLPALPPGLQVLAANDNRLISLPALPPGLRTLRVIHNYLTCLPALPPELQEVVVDGNTLTRLPRLPSGLQTLSGSHNYLTRLPVLPSGLQELKVDDNDIINLSELPSGLRTLWASHNELNCLLGLPTGLQALRVTNNYLTELPALSSGLQELVVDHNRLSSLPELPSGLQTLRAIHNYLCSLPELPSELQELVVSDNSLSSLPELPSGLQVLTVGDNYLTSLPVLPSGLQALAANDNRLTSLPELPSGLQALAVDDNDLASLPALPPGLQTLTANDNVLTSLPVLPSGLQRLTVNNNELTNLPESIAHLPANTRVDLSINPLSERTNQTLQEMIHAPDYSGPMISFNMGGHSGPLVIRPLHQAVADWLVPAREGEPGLAGKWQAFEQQDDAASFSRFLDRLSETENFKKDSGFKTQIASWLALLVEDDELRAKIFAMATEAASSCEDRVTLALNKMKNVQLVHNAEKGEFNENFPGLVSVAREMFRLEILEQIAREKVKTLYFVDEIEVYLGYQNKLKQPLELTSVTAEMRFFGVSGVTESDLQSAEIQVKTAENSQFAEWILQWEPLRKMLERTEPTSWGALCEKKISDYENTYRILSDTELKPAGLLGNTDAERIIGARAMESAERAFLDGLHPLADNMLGRYLKPRWS